MIRANVLPDRAGVLRSTIQFPNSSPIILVDVTDTLERLFGQAAFVSPGSDCLPGSMTPQSDRGMTQASQRFRALRRPDDNPWRGILANCGRVRRHAPPHYF